MDAAPVCLRTLMKLSKPLLPKCAAEMWSRFFPTAALGEFTKSSQHGCESWSLKPRAHIRRTRQGSDETLASVPSNDLDSSLGTVVGSSSLALLCRNKLHGVLGKSQSAF